MFKFNTLSNNRRHRHHYKCTIKSNIMHLQLIRAHVNQSEYSKCNRLEHLFKSWHIVVVFNSRKFFFSSVVVCRNDKPFTCNICGGKFSRYSSLWSHKKLHSGEKNYKCDQCSSSFAKAVYLKNHMRIHSGEVSWTFKLDFKMIFIEF